MRSFPLRWLSVLVLVTAWSAPLRAEYLVNTDFKDSIAGWRGDGQAANLLANGTEDPTGTPVIKIILSAGSSREVYQEIETRDTSTSLTIKVDVFASPDFKRSSFKQDYTIDWKPGSMMYWSDMVTPNVDFWIRGGRGFGWFYKLTNLKPGVWTTLKAHFQGLPQDESRIVNFCVPPGAGAVYIKNPSVMP